MHVDIVYFHSKTVHHWLSLDSLENCKVIEQLYYEIVVEIDYEPKKKQNCSFFFEKKK
jgi:hypothetical protein